MYSTRKVEQRLALAEREFGFRPVYHSIAEIEAFESHLRATGRYIYNEFGGASGTQNLTAYETQWMLNEQVLCLCDAVYTLTRYAYIKDEQNIIHRFAFRIPQKLLFDIICDLEDMDAAIEIIILKARQLGCSTLVELLISHRIIFSYGINAIIGSADRTKTMLMANMLFLFYDHLPVWLRPAETRRVESDQGMLVFGQNSSGVSFQHGAQASGIARGTTPTLYHLSEVASFTDPVNQIEASLFKAVHASPHVFGILESTGEGDKGWWPDTWRHAKANWPYRRSRLCPTFLPWFCGTDIYPTPTWIRTRPVPHGWIPHRDTSLHVAKSELYVRTSPLLTKYLGANYTMPLAQQWFWEVTHEEHKEKGIEATFLQEMAGDDEEALQRSSESVFGHRVIAEIDSGRKRDYETFAIVGQSIEDAHDPDPQFIDYTRERIPIRRVSPKGDVYRWELIPVHFPSPLRETESEDVTGVFLIFHRPRPGVSYSIGVDTSEGKGQDSTVISIWAIGRPGDPDIQCAEFASPYVNHVEAYAFVMGFATYYGQYMEKPSTLWKEPYVSVEQVAAVGDTCQNQMAIMGYSNFHHFTRIDNAPRKIMKQKRSLSGKRGWYTYAWSRPLLTDNFVQVARQGWAEINSPWLIEEMRHWEVHVTATGKEKKEHEEGEHDDRIFAAGMAIYCPHEMDKLAERSKKRIVEHAALPAIDLGDYAGNVVSSAQMRDTRALTLDDLTLQ